MTGASNIGKAGVATIAFNLGQAMDEKKIAVSYLAQHGVSDERFKRLIELKGGKIYVMPEASRGSVSNIFRMIQWIGEIAKNETFDLVHINADTAYLVAIYLWIFKRAGLKKFAVHSHSIMVDENREIIRNIKVVLHKLCRSYVIKNSDLNLACSFEAAKWMFKEDNATIIPNGIDIDHFRFNLEARKKYRNQMHLDGQFVVICVGRLAYQKNVFFTVDIFNEILKKNPNSRLIFVGDGDLRKDLECYIIQNNLKNQVTLLGNRKDIPELLSASDTFLLPSRFEGLGIVYIEAQASGIPTFASDQVPNEAFLTDLMYTGKLDDSPCKWAEMILAHRNATRKNRCEQIKEKKYDIHVAAKLLEECYIDVCADNIERKL